MCEIFSYWAMYLISTLLLSTWSSIWGWKSSQIKKCESDLSGLDCTACISWSTILPHKERQGVRSVIQCHAHVNCISHKKKQKTKSVAIRSLQIWCSVVESGMVIDVLVGWHGCPVTRCKGRVWRAVTIMHFLGVWLGRSRRVFKGTIFWDGFKGLAYEFFLWIFSEQFCFILLLLTFTFLTYVSINFLL